MKSKIKKRLNSYVIRGRNNGAKHKYISANGGKIVVNYADNQVDWQEQFDQEPTTNLVEDKDKKSSSLTADGKMVVEIGFGGGEVLVDLASKRPQDLFIGIEVYPTGIARVLKQIHDNKITNVSLVQHNAIEVLDDMFDDKILDEIRVLFPDPWQKKRHNKRRLLKEDFIKIMANKLRPGGIIHLATDWQEYAEEIMIALTNLEKEKLLKNLCDGYADGRQMSRPITKFEQRAIDEGRQIYEFLFARP